MVGLGLRSTMDIDTSVRNLNLTPYEAKEIINNIINIDLHDGVTFKIKKISGIMDKMEYPGVRFSMDAKLGSLITPINIDISTGDAITPTWRVCNFLWAARSRLIDVGGDSVTK